MTTNELMYDKCTQGSNYSPEARKILKGLCDLLDLDSVEYNRLYQLRLSDVVCELGYFLKNDEKNIEHFLELADKDKDSKLFAKLTVLQDSLQNINNYLQEKYSSEDVEVKGEMRF